MITETFLDLCFTSILSRSSIQGNLPMTRNIFEILQYHSELYKGDIPIQIKNKFECLQKLCMLRLESRSMSSIVDSLIATGKFSSLRDFIEEKWKKEIDQSVSLDFIKQIRNRKKEIALFKDFISIKDLVESVEESKYEGCDDIVEKYEHSIKKLYANMMEENRMSAVELSSSLDLLNDSYSPVLQMIKESMDPTNCISSGFPILDREILKGGFRKRRIYMLGGSTGTGKSTFLINVLSNLTESKKEKTDDTDGVYVYITLENLIDETFGRFYCCSQNKTEDEMYEDIKRGIDIEKVIKERIKQSKNNICFFYFPAHSIGTEAIRLLLDDVSSVYGREKIKGVFIDYLDLLDARFVSDLYRLQLSKITLDFKVLAIDYDVPVITVTQVNRSGYNNEAPDLTSMGESIKKAEHSDFVGMFGITDDGRLCLAIRKNRCGPKDREVVFNIDLSKYKIWTESDTSSPVKFDTISGSSPRTKEDYTSIKYDDFPDAF